MFFSVAYINHFLELKVVGYQKVGPGQECVNLSQFVSDRVDRCSFLYQFCCRL
jgi:hypothetical protein